jgi:undecaprenyl-diphosphatase
MLPDWLQVVVLGVVQGLTEFIPVSSSAHLVLVPYLGGFDERSLAFDVWLHAGTLLAVLLYFRQELLAIARGLLRLDTSEQGVVYRRVGLLLVPASVPVAAVGVLLKPLVADASEDPLLVSLLLLLTAAILTGLERVRAARVRRGSASTADAVEVPQGALQPAGARPASPMWRGDWRGAAPGGAPAATAAGPVALPLGVDHRGRRRRGPDA